MSEHEKVEQAPTVIDVSADVSGGFDDEEHPYCGRTSLTIHIRSTTKYDRVIIEHLGFHAYTVGKKSIHLRGDRYVSHSLLDPNESAKVAIPHFRISAENIGDSFCRVGIRLRHGMEHCKVTILQEGYQPKAPMDATFVKVEDIWYAFATINCLQTIRIEELGDDTDE